MAKRRSSGGRNRISLAKVKSLKRRAKQVTPLKKKNKFLTIATVLTTVTAGYLLTKK